MTRNPEDYEAQIAHLSSQVAAGERHLKAIVDQAPIGMAYLDTRLVFRDANPAYARMLGRTVDSILDRPVREIFPHVETTLLEQVLKSGQPRRVFDVPMTFEVDGQLRMADWDIVALPIPDAAGVPMGVVTYGLDVTERVERQRQTREQRDQLADLDTLKNDFVVVAAHELRTPLTIVAGNAELLADMPGLSDTQRGLLDEIQVGTHRLSEIVDGLLAITHLRAGLFKPDRQPVDVKALVNSLAETFKPRAEAKLLAFETHLPSEAVTAELDEAAITRVLDHLLANALKFSMAGGRVDVTLSAEPETVRVEVADTGIGIARDAQQRLFEPMYQVDPNLPGAGLGLTVAKGLVEAHGGHMGVTSEPGHGSRFWFELPRGPV